MKIAVTGAFSYSGKYIARRFLACGDEVVTLTGHLRRPDPFDGRVRSFSLNFQDPAGLVAGLSGSDVLVNTYWVRFDKGRNTHGTAVANTRRLVAAAVEAGVRRIVHISITNPSAESGLSYFQGKAANERILEESGISYAILRPTVLFGKEDILINNIAWLLRRFPFFALPGDGSYRLQPVYVDDLAELAVDAAYAPDSCTWDAVGPDIFTFREMVQLIGNKIGVPRPLISVPSRLALVAAKLLSFLVRDVMLTSEEVDGLMAGLLVSTDSPRCKTRLSAWLEENKSVVGMKYASELQRHF
jgi:uncharacterized protein YbjT (DUF2867 family)